MNSIIGHKSIRDFFNRVQAIGSLGHAYCFVGQHGVGKRTVARHIAAQTLGVAESALNTHPDFFSVHQEVNEKTGKTKKNIDIDQIRRLRAALSQRPFLAKNKVAIIRDAHKMNNNAANALLKTLEEPASHTLIILTTSDEARLPQTIQSRCQILYFSPVLASEIEASLLQRGATAADATTMARWCMGCPGTALQWMQDPDTLTVYEKEQERFRDLIGKPLYEKIRIIEDLYGDKTDHIAAREHLKRVLRQWHVFLRDIAVGRSRAIHAMEVSSWSVHSITTVYTRIARAITLLDQNIHPRLLIEHILFAIP